MLRRHPGIRTCCHRRKKRRRDHRENSCQRGIAEIPQKHCAPGLAGGEHQREQALILVLMHGQHQLDGHAAGQDSHHDRHQLGVHIPQILDVWGDLVEKFRGAGGFRENVRHFPGHGRQSNGDHRNGDRPPGGHGALESPPERPWAPAGGPVFARLGLHPLGMQIPLDHHDGQGHEDEHQGKHQQRRPPVPIMLIGFDHLKPSDRREPPQPMLVIYIGNNPHTKRNK